MISPTQIQKPANWQDFESLCKKLWGEIWECSDSIKKNGRNGQAQHGVDVYGIPKGENNYYGIQCKGKDEYTHSQLTKDEIDVEIDKAKKFKPSLKKLIFATTANKDAEIEEYVRIKNLTNIKEGLFEIDIFSWEDIVDLISENKRTNNWYVHNILYKDKSNISVTFNGNITETINPVYIRKTIKYFPKHILEKIHNEIPLWIHNINKLNEVTKKVLIDSSTIRLDTRKYIKDYTWCNVSVEMKNTGDNAIDDYRLYLTFDSESTEDISDGLSFINNPLIVDRMNVNIQRINNQEVFISKNEKNTIEIIPKIKTIVSTETKRFKFKIKPIQGVDNINVKWRFISRNFQDSGGLNIKVNPIYEDVEKIIYTDSEDIINNNEIKIYPKIIEK